MTGARQDIYLRRLQMNLKVACIKQEPFKTAHLNSAGTADMMQLTHKKNAIYEMADEIRARYFAVQRAITAWATD